MLTIIINTLQSLFSNYITDIREFKNGEIFNISITGNTLYPYCYLVFPTPISHTSDDLNIADLQLSFRLYQKVSVNDNRATVLTAQDNCIALAYRIVETINTYATKIKADRNTVNIVPLDPETIEGTNDYCAGCSLDFTLKYNRC